MTGTRICGMVDAAMDALAFIAGADAASVRG
jgi:hypothetical protein